MAASVIVDAGFLVALLSKRDSHHEWAVRTAERFPPPWRTSESALSEAYHLAGRTGLAALNALLERRAAVVALNLDDHTDAVVRFLTKYRDVPASLADATLVRLTETVGRPVLLTTDSDFRVYRRHGRQVVPCVMPE
jgi:predicted nucleic acid-binding protein